MPAQTEEYTLGVEEEYQIVDPETRELRARGGRVLQRAQHDLSEEEVAPEILTPQVEIMTPVCRTLAEVRAEILRLRRGVAQAAAKEGGRIAAASTTSGLPKNCSRSASTCTSASRTGKQRFK
jgi:carboxylate-amine ligase